MIIKILKTMIWCWWNECFHRQPSSVDIIYSRPGSVSGVCWVSSFEAIWTISEDWDLETSGGCRQAGGQEEVAPPGQEAANFFSILNSGEAELLPLTPLLTCWCESGFHSLTASRWILTPALILTADSESDPPTANTQQMQECCRFHPESKLSQQHCSHSGSGYGW